MLEPQDGYFTGNCATCSLRVVSDIPVYLN